MPNCFQLFKLTDPKKACIFQEVDKEICAHFNTPVHATEWHRGWYNYIGLLCAIGKTWPQIRESVLKWNPPPTPTKLGT